MNWVNSKEYWPSLNNNREMLIIRGSAIIPLKEGYEYCQNEQVIELDIEYYCLITNPEAILDYDDDEIDIKNALFFNIKRFACCWTNDNDKHYKYLSKIDFSISNIRKFIDDKYLIASWDLVSRWAYLEE